MFVVEQAERDLAVLRLPQIGRIVASDGVVPWVVLDAAGQPVAPIQEYLRDFVARGRKPSSVLSYARDLHRWWRFLAAVGVEWDKATSLEVRDLVLWLQATPKMLRHPRTATAATAGRINPVSGKKHVGDDYGARTIRHSNSVIRAFYKYWIEEVGEGPLVNPVVLERTKGRPNAHHNPLEPYRTGGGIRYNPKVPKRRPRQMPDERWRDLFAAMGSNRDRAILAFGISTAARAAELLGVRSIDVDWGNQLIRVCRKGSGEEQWLQASPEAFVWLRLYLNDLGMVLASEDPLWVTLRRRRGAPDTALKRLPLTYDALRAVLRRANAKLGANWTMHDLRHTCALRMINDDGLSLRDVQFILGHDSVTTTEIYLVEDEQKIFERVRAFHATQGQADVRPGTPAGGYQQADLDLLFGGRLPNVS